jgi:starch-binding outer membrane protein, SusD/RagB family
MKSFFKILLTLQLIFCFVSCSDFLDTTPTSVTPETYFNNKEEVKSFLTSVYAPLMAESFYGGDYAWKIAAEDLGYYARTAATGSVVSGSTNISDGALQSTWRILYDGINRANMMLENIDRAIPAAADSVVREQYRSETRFLRAFYYFTLVENFGDVPFRTNTPSDINSLSLARTNKEVIYDFIISEMIASEPYLLNATQVNPGHVTKSALQGVLARVYLFRAGEGYREAAAAPGVNAQTYFAEAKKWALKVKDSGLHGLVSPYNQIFIDLAADKYNSTGVKESIWEVEEAGNRSTTILAAGRLGNTLGFGGPDLSAASGSPYANVGGLANPGMSYNYINCTLKLFDMYESEKDTARGNWNITPFAYTTTGTAATLKITGRKYYYGKIPASMSTLLLPGKTYTDANGFIYSVGSGTDTLNTSRCLAKYRREYEQALPKNKNYTPTNFPLLRYSDVLLMIAEAENELNADPTALAYECLDAVRSRAKITTLTGSGLTKDQFREVIKKERGMELCYEGTRRFDLIRWGDYLKAMTDVSTLLEMSPKWPVGVKYAANYFKISPAYLYLPIPAYELSVNKLILFNNPGW